MSEKQALVPRLRFPEFRGAGEWNNFKLTQISERLQEKVGSRKLTTVSITAGFGFVSQVEKFGRDISGEQYKNYILLKHGEFSYNKGNSKAFPQGCIYQLDEFNKVAAPSAFISFKFNSDFVPEFFKGYFDSNFHGYQLLRFITSGARSDGLLNISPAHFFSIRLPTPQSKGEQQKIADCLSSLDTLIAAQAEKIDALKTHKKGLMQQLFPREGETVPRLRFPEFRGAGEWDVQSVGDLKPFITSGSRGWAAYYADQGELFVRITNLWRDSIYLDLTDSKFVQLPTGANEGVRTQLKEHDVLISITADIGIVGYVDNSVPSPAYINQHIALVRFDAAKMSGKYVAYFLASERPQQLFYASTDTGAKAGMSLIGIQKIEVMLPRLREQQRIADCLSSLDTLIAAQAEKIDALKTHKKGLMQQLFPSPEAMGA